MLFTAFEDQVWVSQATLDLTQSAGVESTSQNLMREPAVVRRAVRRSGEALSVADLPPSGPPLLGHLIDWFAGDADPDAALRRSIRVEENRSGLIQLRVATHDPKLSQSLGNALALAAMETATERRIQALEQGMAQARRDVAAQKERLLGAQRRLADHRRSTPAVESDAIRQTRIEELELERIAAAKQRAVLEAKLRTIEQNIRNLDVVSESPQLERLQEEKRDIERQIAELAMRFKPEYPKYAAARKQLRKLEGRLDEEAERTVDRVRSHYQEAVEREEVLRRTLEHERHEGLMATSRDSDGSMLEARVEMERELLAAMTARLDRSLEQSSLGLVVPRLLEPASLPNHPAGPRPLLRGLAAASLTALLFGIQAMLAALRRRARARTAHIEITRHPMMEALPGPTTAWLSAGESQLLPASASEAPRQERDSWADPGPVRATPALPTSVRGSRVITSAHAGEGRSSMALRLAAALAQQGSRVVLVDADLRNPSLHRVLRLQERPGLVEVVSREARFQEAAQAIRAPNLYVLTAGRKTRSPERVLGSEEMQQLVHYLEEKVDHVIFDAPPVDADHGTALLASSAVAVTLVVDARISKPEDVIAAARKLEEAGALNVTTVANTHEPEPFDSLSRNPKPAPPPHGTIEVIP